MNFRNFLKTTRFLDLLALLHPFYIIFILIVACALEWLIQVAYSLKINGGHLLILVELVYSQNISSWSIARQYAMRNRDGTFDDGFFLWTKYAQMDPTTDFYQQTLINVTSTLARYGVDGIQLDSFPYYKTICYNQNHDHPIGGGNWYFQGWRDLLIRLMNEARKINPNFVLTSEGIAELIFIPLWHTVYHEYSIAYGVQVCLLIHITRTCNSSLVFFIRAIGMHVTQGIIPNTWTSSSSFLTFSPELNKMRCRTYGSQG